MLKKIFTVLALLLVVGCTGLQQRDWNDPTRVMVRGLLVQDVAGRTLDANPSWVEPTARITTEAIAYMDGDQEVLLAQVKDYVLARIPLEGATPEELELIAVVLDDAVAQIMAQLITEGLDSPDQVRVSARRVLLWVNQAATRRL